MAAACCKNGCYKNSKEVGGRQNQRRGKTRKTWMMSNRTRKYGCEKMENESLGQTGRGIYCEGSQDQTIKKKKIELERVYSQTQLCQLRCLMTILDIYMFRPLLAIFRLSLTELKLLLYSRTLSSLKRQPEDGQ